MRKLSMLLLALVGAVVFTSCSDSETYADQKKKERSAINSYIVKNGIKVISEDEFFKDYTQRLWREDQRWRERHRVVSFHRAQSYDRLASTFKRYHFLRFTR